MKKITIILISLIGLINSNLFAQTGEQMQIYRTGGVVDTYNLSDIDSITFTPCPSEIFKCGDNFTDPRDGQSYKTVQIGTQCWMAQNLNIGTQIDGIIDQTNNGIIEKYCYDDVLSNCNKYGGLYKWNEMMNYTTYEGAQGICPTGWHVPTDGEYKQLFVYLDPTILTDSTFFETNMYWRGTNIGTQLKQGGSSNFDALLGGWYDSDLGTYCNISYGTCVATSTTWNLDPTYAMDNQLFSPHSYDHGPLYNEELHAGAGKTTRAISVRCLKNN